jgi:RNA polymerase sigma-70 factor (ECF subfamily)
MKTDLELFQEIKTSNEKAFEILFDKYYKQLCSFCDFYVKDSSLSEELVADVFASLWIKRDTLLIEYNVKNYLYTIAKNNSLAHLRKNKIVTLPINREVENSSLSSCLPEKMILDSEKENKLAHILDILPTQSRKVFELHKFEGFKYKEIADLLNISVKTVENHIGKALKILRENYKVKSSLFVLLLKLLLIK